MSGTLPHPITQGDFSQRPVPGKPGHGHVLPESLQVLRRRLVASVTRLYPFYTGCGTMANCGVVRMLAGKSTGPDWVRLRQGPYLRVMLGDYLSNAVYFSRDWDRKISWVCERLLRPGDITLDIGANLGLVACQMGALVGPSGQVHAFEPNPSVSGLLQESIVRNGFNHVTLHCMGLGDIEQELELTIPHNLQCLATLARHEEGTKIRVPIKTLSGWYNQYKVPRIRLMKIDVEGFEPQVFRGAEHLFKAVRPDAVLFELNHYDGPFEAHPVVQFLKVHEYDFLMLPKRMLRMCARRLISSAIAGSPSNDLIAVPKGKVYDEIVARLKA
ncbi:FkbM family methyltransferase [Pedosphaera parvula]|uniref:Methyltransferase FkbM family n=1 Tax=Pedosphaera parvula (strain Ellin514) TaxID=320771 RepID=B9XCB9_PEDPL|nr:FkbM family methyltransferase [Pedosphaera parvula]EEF62587.1 methyltransferase FkbM family [Pedosphaera parvula Ellin514]